MRVLSPSACLLALVAVGLSGIAACNTEEARSTAQRLESSCLQRGFSSDVCSCASEATARELETTEVVGLEADAVAKQLEREIARCMISTGAHRDAVLQACMDAAPLTQKRAEACACAADKVARDERVLDVLDRRANSPLPGFAEELLFTCAYETGAIDMLLANVCGGTTETPHCVCLKERFTAAFPPKVLTGMSSETLRANASDMYDRCVVGAPHIQAGLMKACQSVEKKESVCVCAVKKFIDAVPPSDVLTILQNGWTTDSMAAMNAARRACGGKPTKR